MNPGIAQTWAERAQAELGASRRFRELSVRLQALDTHPKILELISQAENDEDRHAVLCARMAIELGHETGFAHMSISSDQDNLSWSNIPDEKDRILLDLVLLC